MAISQPALRVGFAARLGCGWRCACARIGIHSRGEPRGGAGLDNITACDGLRFGVSEEFGCSAQIAITMAGWPRGSENNRVRTLQDRLYWFGIEISMRFGFGFWRFFGQVLDLAYD